MDSGVVCVGGGARKPEAACQFRMRALLGLLATP